MSDDYDVAAVLAQVAKRKAEAEALNVERGFDGSPESGRAALQQVERQRRARAAARAGQLDLGGR